MKWIDAPNGKEFIFKDGRKAKNILELKEILQNIKREDFYFFVNESKNDFANWIEHVLNDSDLVSKLRKVSSLEETLIILDEVINSTLTSNFKISFENKESPHEVIRNDKNIRQEMHKENNQQNNQEKYKEIPNETHQEMHQDKYQEKHSGNDRKIEHTLENNTIHDPKRPITGDWFNFFSKKRLTKNSLEKLEKKEQEKHKPENDLKHEVKEYAFERWFWMFLYGFLIVVILAFFIYTFIR